MTYGLKESGPLRKFFAGAQGGAFDIHRSQLTFKYLDSCRRRPCQGSNFGRR